MRSCQVTSLATARWIVLVFYLTGLAVYPLVGAFAAPKAPPVPPETLRLLGQVLLAAGVADYLASLLVERALLARAGNGNPQAVAARTAIVVGAFGESLAILALVLALLGAGAWSVPLYGLCFLHGVHLALRWPSYVTAAAGQDER